ncbi:MAG: SulP family inorganic anion transporter, partial [Patescibacteria group bacterium]|nr:SulP family inorganic anion transporter [Patescibacteria group bacterium]
IIAAFAVALVAILETMISAKIADGMTGTRHSRRKEMRGLALANIVSGLFGGMPATAALARTSLNIKTGATSKISAAISSFGVAIIALFFLKFFKFIPLAVIAAILVFVAVQMVEAEHFMRMFKYDRKNFYLSLVTAAITVFEDPIIGILFGVGVASLLLMEKLSRGQFDLAINDSKKGMVDRINGDRMQKIVQGSDTIVYSIKGLLCYINSESHVSRFRLHLNGSKNVILRMRSVYYIDMDGVEAVDEIVTILKNANKNVYVTGVSSLISEMLSESPGFKQLKAEGRVYKKSSDALRHLGFSI